MLTPRLRSQEPMTLRYQQTGTSPCPATSHNKSNANCIPSHIVGSNHHSFRLQTVARLRVCMHVDLDMAAGTPIGSNVAHAAAQQSDCVDLDWTAHREWKDDIDHQDSAASWYYQSA